MRTFNLFVAIVLAFLLASCSAPKKVAYIQKADEIPAEILAQIPAPAEATIMPGDLLNIDVTGSDMTALAPFNRNATVDAEGRVTQSRNYGNAVNSNSTNGISSANLAYYLVTTDGYITFPMLGEIHVSGLTKKEVAEEIVKAIYPRYVKEKPQVEVRLINFRVYMLGAVVKNGVVNSPNERLNILQAISMAGDLQIQAQRDNVLIYRIGHDGKRELHRIDLTDPNLLLSPYYNLQQDDIIYVEPNTSAKNKSWQLSPVVSTVLTFVGGLSSVAGLIIGIVNLTKL